MASFLYRWSLTDGKGVVLEFSFCRIGHLYRVEVVAIGDRYNGVLQLTSS